MRKRVLTLSVLILLAFAILTNCSKNETKSDQADSNKMARPSLQAALDEKKNLFEQKASPEVVRIFDEGVLAVANSGVMETALKIGEIAPDFTLPNVFNKYITLSALLTDGPVILTWYRGGW